MSEKELIPFLANLRTSTWEAVRISGLAKVDEGSQAWEEGTKSVQAGLEAVSDDHLDDISHLAHFLDDSA